MKCDANPEVSKWLLNQPWTGKFVDNLIKENMKPEDTLFVLLGGDGYSTISAAFDWWDSPEGHEFWNEKHDELVHLWKTNKWAKSIVWIDI